MAAPLVGPNGLRPAKKSPVLTAAVTYRGSMKPSKTNSFGQKIYTSDDLQKAYNTAHTASGPNGTAIILGEAGYFEGFGAGSNDDPSIRDVGVNGRTSHVLMYPVDGYGGFKLLNKSAKFTNLRNLTIGGIQGGEDDELGVLFVGGGEVGLWRSSVGFMNGNGAPSTDTKYLYFDEVVVPNARVYESDSSAMRSSSRSSSTSPYGPLSYVYIDGCYLGPTYRPTGTDSHTDTLQFSGDSPYDHFFVTNTMIVGSTNHGLIIGGAGYVELSNVYIAAGYLGKLMYPPTGVALPPSAYAGNPVGTVSDPIALNGGGVAGQLKMTDVTIIGRIKNAFAAMVGSTLTNVRTSDSASAKNGVQYDATLLTKTASQIATEQSPKPTRAYLRTLWGGSGVTPTPDPTPVPEPTDTTDPTVTFVTASGPVSNPAQIIVEATHPIGVASLAFTTTVAGKVTPLGPGVKLSGNQWALTFNTDGVPAGAYPVVATASSTAGREGSAERSFTVAASGGTPPVNQAPIVTFLLPLAGTVLPRNGDVPLRARATDDLFVNIVEWECDTPSGIVSLGFGDLTSTSNVFEKIADGATLPTGLTRARVKATDTGTPQLTTTSEWVPMTVAPAIDRTLPTPFGATLVSRTANSITIEWTAATDPADQEIRYQPKKDGSAAADRQTARTYTYRGLAAGTAFALQVDAYDPDENVRSSNELTVSTLSLDTIKPSTPTLSVDGIGTAGAHLHATGSTDNVGVLSYRLRRFGDLIDENADIAHFADIALTLQSATRYEYSLAAWDGAQESDPATVAFTTLTVPAVIPAGWLRMVGPVADGVRLAQGTVETNYSAEIATAAGLTITTAPQKVNLSKGEFSDPDTGAPLLLFRSSNPEHFIYWVETFLVGGRPVRRPPRYFRIPAAVSDPDGETVKYSELQFFEELPQGVTPPAWLADMDGRITELTAAAAVITDAFADLELVPREIDGRLVYVYREDT